MLSHSHGPDLADCDVDEERVVEPDSPVASTARLAEHPVSTVRLYERDGGSVVEVTGDLDIQSVPRIRRLRSLAGSRLLVDLSGVTFVDCGGLRAVLGPAVSGPTCRVVVCGRPSRARTLLELVGWNRGLLYESVGEAIRATATPPSAPRSSASSRSKHECERAGL